MKTTLKPLSPRAEQVIEEYGVVFEVLATEKTAMSENILVRSLDGQWQGVFDKSECDWDSLLEGE